MRLVFEAELTGVVETQDETAYPSADRLGDAFVEILKSWLSPAEIDEVARRNREETSKHVCHSHDFCDANMAMHEAWTSFGLQGVDGNDDFECAL